MKNKTDSRESLLAMWIAAALCVFLLAFMCTDSEKYKNDTVPASITYTPPQRMEDEGFWEIFSDAVIKLFNIEA